MDTLFTDLNKPHEKVVKTFHLSETGEWVAEHEELYSYLEDGFSEYLNVRGSSWGGVCVCVFTYNFQKRVSDCATAVWQSRRLYEAVAPHL